MSVATTRRTHLERPLRAADGRAVEHACRAGTTTLFCFGDSLPDEAEHALARLGSSVPDQRPANDFGLAGSSSASGADRYRPSYNQARRRPGVCVRGGGASSGHGRYEEWVWCMSAMRMPSSDLPDSACVSIGLRTGSARRRRNDRARHEMTRSRADSSVVLAIAVAVAGPPCACRVSQYRPPFRGRRSAPRS